MLAEVIKILQETEKLRGDVIKLAERYAESEKEKESFFKELIRKEHECERLKAECDRLRSLCRTKDRMIMNSGSERKNELLNQQSLQRQIKK